jgi:hypothetical protein
MNDTPTCTQINRACTLYSSGANAEAFKQAFANELSEHGMALAWCAAITAFAIDERYPFTSNRRH